MMEFAAWSLGSKWGVFTIVRGAGPTPVGPAVRSYDSGGMVLSWRTTALVVAACDIERRDRLPDPALARLAAGPDFWRFWVLAEVAAKLLDMPILEWLMCYRGGAVPEQSVRARALVIPRFDRRWALAFGLVDPTEAPGSRLGRRRDAWGFVTGKVGSPGVD